MRHQRIIHIFALPALLVFSGCGYVHLGKTPEPVTTVIGDDKLMKENADLRLEKKMLQQELLLTRSQGEALRSALENRAADGDTSKRLVEKLNETTRELSTLRANYARLQTERNQAVSSAAESSALRAQLGAAEEKLAGALRTYTELQEEVVRLKGDVDRTRAENVVLGEQVKTITAHNDQAQAALAQLNTDLLAQKDARFRAEQDAETLRTELKAAAPNSSALAQQRTGAAAEARSLVTEHAAEVAALKQQIEQTRTEVSRLSEERAQLQQKLGASETAKTIAPELADAEAKLSTAIRSAQSLRDQLKETQNQVALLYDENVRLKARVEAAAAPAPAPVPAAFASGPMTVTSGGVTLTQKPSGVSATLVASVPGAPRNTGKPDAMGGRTHVVSGGDTLAKISTQYYGTPGRWGDILAANREVLGENNNLVVGRTLRIP